MADQTQTTTNWLQPQWQDYLSKLNGALGSTNFAPYSGQTVAPWNQNQNTAADMWSQFAQNGTPAGNAASGAAQSLASGTYNPYAGATNPMAGQANPFTQQVVNNTNQSMTDAYGRGV